MAGSSAVLRLDESSGAVSGRVEKLFTEARAEAAAGNYAGALSLFERILRIEPDCVAAAIWCVECLFKIGSEEDGEALLRELVKNNPEDSVFHTTRAAILFDRGRYDEAIAAATEGLEVADNDFDRARAHGMRGLALSRRNRLPEAVADFGKSAELLNRYEPSQLIDYLIECMRTVCLWLGDVKQAGGKLEAGTIYRNIVLIDDILKQDIYEAAYQFAEFLDYTVGLFTENENSDYFDNFYEKQSLAESNTANYTGLTPPSETADRSPPLRMRDDFNRALAGAKAEALTGPKTEWAAARLLANYQVLVRHVDLENPKLAADERLRRAGRLLTAYDRLLRAKPEFKDSNPQLTAARRIKKAAHRQRQMAMRPGPAPRRGRPPKAAHR